MIDIDPDLAIGLEQVDRLGRGVAAVAFIFPIARLFEEQPAGREFAKAVAEIFADLRIVEGDADEILVRIAMA